MPRIARKDILEKFRGNAKLVIAQERADELIRRVQKLESVENVKQLVELVTLP